MMWDVLKILCPDIFNQKSIDARLVVNSECFQARPSTMRWILIYCYFSFDLPSTTDEFTYGLLSEEIISNKDGITANFTRQPCPQVTFSLRQLSRLVDYINWQYPTHQTDTVQQAHARLNVCKELRLVHKKMC